MGGVVNALSGGLVGGNGNFFNNLAHFPGKVFSAPFTAATQAGLIDKNSGLNKVGEFGGKVFETALNAPWDLADSATRSGSPPGAPGINKNLGKTQAAQLENAQSFRDRLPGLENQLGHQLGEQSNQQMGQNLHDVRQSNSHRGLLYGGINAGDEQQVRGHAASSLAQGRSNINSGMENAANTLDAQAIKTGMGVQQTQQSIQNSIYGQALANMQAQNQLIGGVFGGMGKIGGLLAAG